MKAHPHRFERLDALRGTAMVWMAMYHFAFDLSHFGLVPRQDFNHDPLWLAQRTAILSLFLFCAGVGSAIASASGQSWQRFWIRWAQIAGGAVLVSIGSWMMFPKSWISFGVLHAIAVMLIVARVTAPLGAWLWLVGSACLALPQLVQHPMFDTRWTNWVGLVTHKPLAEDYVPLLPWLGVMLWGVAAGQWMLRHRPDWLGTRVAGAFAPLAVLGRRALPFYLLHQPVLIGLVAGARALLR